MSMYIPTHIYVVLISVYLGHYKQWYPVTCHAQIMVSKYDSQQFLGKRLTPGLGQTKWHMNTETSSKKVLKKWLVYIKGHRHSWKWVHGANTRNILAKIINYINRFYPINKNPRDHYINEKIKWEICKNPSYRTMPTKM